MANRGSVAVTLGPHTEDEPYGVVFTESGTIHVDIAPNTTMVFWTAGELYNLADTLRTAAQEADEREYRKADNPPLVTHADRIVDSIKNPDG